MIVPITNPDLVNNLLPIMLKTKDLPFSPHGYLNYIKEAIVTDCAILLVNINDANEFDSMAFAETIINITDREAMFNFAYVDPKQKEVGIEFWDLINKWAIDKECKRICCITNKLKARAMKKKYGFDQNWSYLTKEIERS